MHRVLQPECGGEVGRAVRDGRAVQAAERAGVVQELGAGEPVEQPQSVGQHAQRLLGDRRVGPDVGAVDPHDAGVGAEQAGDHRERRRLAGAVGADEAEERAGAHLELDGVDRHGVAEGLAEVDDRERDVERRAGRTAGEARSGAADGRRADRAGVAVPARLAARGGFVEPAASTDAARFADRRRSSTGGGFHGRGVAPARLPRAALRPAARFDRRPRPLLDRPGAVRPTTSAAVRGRGRATSAAPARRLRGRARRCRTGFTSAVRMGEGGRTAGRRSSRAPPRSGTAARRRRSGRPRTCRTRA